MTKQELHQFLSRYFSLFQCQLQSQSSGHVEVQLCEEIDKDLFHRPFYWSYIESIQGTPQTHRLTLVTDEEQTPAGVEGDRISIGSPLLHRIFRSCQRRGQMTRLYEEWVPEQPSPLTPWLGINGKVLYKCDRTKETYFSLGCNGLTGEVMDSFCSLLQKRALQMSMPPFHYLLRPIFGFESSLLRMQELLLHQIKAEPKEWADRALQRFHHEKEQLEAYYEDLITMAEDEEEEKNLVMEWEQRINELHWQYQPEIQIIPMQIGIYYLQDYPRNIENSRQN